MGQTMNQEAREAYLATQIMTATPQKLRLMLIDGAIKSATQTIDCWREDEHEEGSERLILCRQIISELLSSIRQDSSEISKNATNLYAFLFRALTEAQMENDIERLQNVIRILEVERDTWQQVCEELPEAPSGWSESQEPKEITASGVPIPPPHKAPSGISLDA